MPGIGILEYAKFLTQGILVHKRVFGGRKEEKGTGTGLKRHFWEPGIPEISLRGLVFYVKPKKGRFYSAPVEKLPFLVYFGIEGVKLG